VILLQHADQLSYEELMALDTAALVVQIMGVTGLDNVRLHIVWVQWSTIGQ